MDSTKKPQVRIKLVEINSHLTCPLCKGYFIDATTISECLHSFCRSCIIRFLYENSYCPICELIINKARPNLKLDKTLQDIVYKLVPELFLNEMRRRQRFYRSYPELATKVTPEEKGEDTERTIFNPRDTISLSIEYISDDSTPGAIVIPQLIGKGADSNNKNIANELTDEEGNNAIRRFLQCPGMCRIDVLKKFICNKYNVDTNQYYIDILYKRVPLPDHYTLIDVAYIYSWKRNEPMKFFFKITDINLVTDSFDYLIPKQAKHTYEIRVPKTTTKPNRTIKVVKSEARINYLNKTRDVKCSEGPKTPQNNLTDNTIHSNIEATPKLYPTAPNLANNVVDSQVKHSVYSRDYIAPEPTKSNKNIKTIDFHQQRTSDFNNFSIGTTGAQIKTEHNEAPRTESDNIQRKNDNVDTEKEDMVRIQKEAIEQFKKNEKRKEFTNVTLDRNNHVEIITKIQKVSNKSGLQIGIKITKQTFKKSQLAKLADGTDQEYGVEKSPQTRDSSPKALTSSAVPDMDIEKSNFLKSIELTAKHVIKAMVPKILDLPKTTSKRKNSSPIKTKKCSKKPKKYINIQPKAIQNPAVWQMVSNVNQNVSNLSKIVEQMTPNSSSTNSDLQALLYDSYKINIPSSLSVTVKNDKDTPNSSYQKPVQNYIEILKLPDVPAPLQTKLLEIKDESRPNILDKLNSSITVNKVEVEVKTEPKTPDVENRTLPPMSSDSDIKVENNCDDTSRTSAVIPPKLTDSNKRENLLKLSPRISPQTFQKMFEETLKKTEPSATSPNIAAENLVQNTALNLSTNDSGAKRNIMEIASKLYKKSKLEHDKSINTSKFNPPLKDFDSYISQQKSNTQTLSNLHSPKLGLNYTVSVTQDVSPEKSLQNGLPHVETCKLPKKDLLPRIPTLPSPKKSTVLNVPRKYSTPSDNKEVSSTSPAKSPKYNAAAASSEKDQLNPDQILEKYNIQNLAQLTANFNFPPNLLSSTANQLAAFRQAMIYKHFEMQNHQNWLNMNPGPLVQYEKYLKGFSKSST